MIHLVYTSLHICDIGVGAGPAGLVLARPLFSGGGGGGGGGNEIYYIYIFKCMHALRVSITAGPFQKSFLCPCEMESATGLMAQNSLCSFLGTMMRNSTVHCQDVYL